MTDPQRLLVCDQLDSIMRQDLLLAQQEESFDVHGGLALFSGALLTESLSPVPSSISDGTGVMFEGSTVAFEGSAQEATKGALSKALASSLAQGSFWGTGVVGVAGVLLALQLATPAESKTAQEREQTVQGSSVMDSRSWSASVDSRQPPRPQESSAALSLTELPDESSSPGDAEHCEDNVKATLGASEVPWGAKPLPSKASTLNDEVAELRELRNRLSGDPQAVLRDINASPFLRSGVLGPEREALAIDALLLQGRDEEAQLRAKAFVLAHPAAPAAERLRQL